jgi:hypothetical protein
VYNVEVESVKAIKIVPSDDWGGQGLLGADISFGFLNKLPLRQKDQENNAQRDKMKSIFGRLTSEDNSESATSGSIMTTPASYQERAEATKKLADAQLVKDERDRDSEASDSDTDRQEGSMPASDTHADSNSSSDAEDDLNAYLSQKTPAQIETESNDNQNRRESLQEDRDVGSDEKRKKQ